MRAVQVDEFGGPGVLGLRDVPEPDFGADEAVIAVEAIDTLVLDTAIRRGEAVDWFDVRPPYVPGQGVAGHVVAMGANVDPAWQDRRVVARTGQQGAYADRVVVPESALVAVPEGLPLEDAVALLHDGLTAMALLEAAAITDGDRVLVLGAGGGMGVLLVQLATAAGGIVVAAARGERKSELARDLGARDAVDYGEPGWEDRALAAAGGGRFAVVFDGVGGDLGRAAFALTEPGGHFSAHGAPSGDFAAVSEQAAAERGITLRGISDLWFGPDDQRRLTQAALDAAAAGALRPVVGQTFTLDRAAEAHAAIEERRVVGKTLLVTTPRAA